MSDEKKGWEKDEGTEGPVPPEPIEVGADSNQDYSRDNSRDNRRDIHNITLDSCHVTTGGPPIEVIKAIEALALASAEHAKALKAMARALGRHKGTSIGVMIGGDANGSSS